jgi:hypothetical protein
MNKKYLFLYALLGIIFIFIIIKLSKNKIIEGHRIRYRDNYFLEQNYYYGGENVLHVNPLYIYDYNPYYYTPYYYPYYPYY